MITISARYHRQLGAWGQTIVLMTIEEIEKIPFFIFSVEGIIFFHVNFLVS